MSLPAGAGRRLALMLALATLACHGRGPEEDLQYEGSSTIGELLLPQLSEAYALRTGARFSTIGNEGSGAGFASVMNGKTSLGGLARFVTDAERAKAPFYRIIAYDAIAIFLHEKNPVSGLTSAQVKDIYTGRITNWKLVGGPDAPIEVVTEIKTGTRATRMEFRHAALGGAEFGPTHEIDKPADCVAYVAGREWAITHASLGFAGPGVKPLPIDGIAPTPENVSTGAYFATRPLVLVSRGVPTGQLGSFFDFVVSAEGQAIVAQTFAPIR